MHPGGRGPIAVGARPARGSGGRTQVDAVPSPWVRGPPVRAADAPGGVSLDLADGGWSGVRGRGGADRPASSAAARRGASCTEGPLPLLVHRLQPVFAPVAQSEERRSRKAQASGSIPLGGSTPGCRTQVASAMSCARTPAASAARAAVRCGPMRGREPPSAMRRRRATRASVVGWGRSHHGGRVVRVLWASHMAPLWRSITHSACARSSRVAAVGAHRMANGGREGRSSVRARPPPGHPVRASPHGRLTSRPLG